MFKMPAQDSPLRELFVITDLMDEWNLSSFRQANNAARLTFRNSVIKKIPMVVLMDDHQLCLLLFAQGGTWKKLWDFGRLGE